MDLLDRIDRWGGVSPGHVAQVSGGRRLTYGELRRRSDSVAAYLAEQLEGDGSPVAVVGHKEPEMLIGFLGAVKAGHPYIPLDVVFPPERIDRICRMAGVRTRLTAEEIEHVPERAIRPGTKRVGIDDPYYIIFTSGSTGEPKGVVITLRCLSAFVSWMLAEHKFGEQPQTFLNQAPFSFDLSVMDLYLGLATGSTIYSVRNSDIAHLKDLYISLAASALTTWVSTPSFAQLCLSERTFDESMLPLLRRFLFCGETLAPALAAELLRRFPRAEVWNTYGPTETTVAVTSIRITEDILARYESLPVGYPMHGARVVLRDVLRGRGEIVIASDTVSPGYFRRPDLTSESFVSLDGDRAYRTGDWGRLEGDLLFFEGRMDHQIKLSGYRIEIGEIEAVLRAMDAVSNAVVIPRLKNGAIASLAAAVIPADIVVESERQFANQLRTVLRTKLPAYMLPRKFALFEAFPLTPNGKVDRHRLAELVT
jgi:D-alanine--poly(phosphoribitol) ligase subunit 1